MSNYFLVNELARVQHDERLREAEQARRVNEAHRSRAGRSVWQSLIGKLTRQV